MNKQIQRAKYIFFDFVAGGGSYVSFYIFRKIHIEPQKFGYDIPIEFSSNFFWGLLIIPFFWVFIHLLSGYYRTPMRKSRLHELGQTFLVTFLGVIFLFFALLLDDWVSSYKHYYITFITLFSLQFTFTYLPRLIITSITNKRIHNRKLCFNTLMVGSNKKAVNLYHEFEQEKKSSGLNLVGFLNVESKENYLLSKYIPHLGNIKDIKETIQSKKIEEVVIALESTEHSKIENILNLLTEHNVDVKVIPDMYDILIGKVRMTAIFGTPVIQIHRNLMPVWQQHTKRIMDIVLSFLAIIVLLPIYIAISIGVKISSSGPIIYSHKRVGKNGNPFTIYKFRSMVQNAESNGPELSSKADKRVTRFGRFLRKTRLDEIPQFFNVIKGDMSLVGPRPERQHFIDQIIEKAPHYVHLRRIRPGITSWGQVKYGYAENVDQMIQRLKYDIIYIENMSISVDFKILIYTIKIIFQGKGI